MAKFNCKQRKKPRISYHVLTLTELRTLEAVRLGRPMVWGRLRGREEMFGGSIEGRTMGDDMGRWMNLEAAPGNGQVAGLCMKKLGGYSTLERSIVCL